MISSVALAAISSSTFAADLPSIKLAPTPAPVPMWTGFYVGVNAGGTWSNNSPVNITTLPFTSGTNGGYWQTASQATGSVQTGNNAGFIGGGQIGYNWQARYGTYNFVAGVEADIQGIATGYGGGTGLVNIIPVGAAGNNLSSVTANTSLSWIGTVRGRLGYLFTPTLLIYGTGGLAYGGTNLKVSTFQNLQDHEVGVGFDLTLASAAFGSSSIASTPVGWTVGGGLEWMFLPNWSAKAEYLYYSLGSLNSSLFTTGLGYLNGAYIGTKNLYSSNASTNFTGNIVRAGVNYHFNFASAPVIAKF